MVNTLAKTTLREIRQSLGRYLAILAIIAIGVAIFAGLRMSEPAMIETGDVYLDEQLFYDLRLISTLGFTEEDVDEFASLDGVELARGSIFAEFLCHNEGGNDAVLIAHSITPGVNEAFLVSGRMPQNANECLADAGVFSEKDIGTTIKVSASNDDSTLELLKFDEYIIVGLADSPLYINYERGTSSIGSGSISAFILLPEDGFESDIYYDLFIRISKRAPAYSDDYQPLLDDVKPSVESALKLRAKHRFDSLYSDALEQINDGESELADGRAEYANARAEAEAELADALAKLQDGEAEYTDGLEKYRSGLNDYYSGLEEYEEGLEEIAKAEKELSDGRSEYEKAKAEAEAELADAYALLADGEVQYADGLQQYNDGLAELAEGERLIAENEAEMAAAKLQLDTALMQLSQASTELKAAEKELEEGRVQLEQTKILLDEAQKYIDYFADLLSQGEDELTKLDPESSDYAVLQDLLDKGYEVYNAVYAEFSAGLAQYEEGYAQYLDGLAQYEAGLAAYNDGMDQYWDGYFQYEDGKAQLAQAKLELEVGREELAQAKSELDTARAELDSGWLEYNDGKTQAEEEFAKAEAELADGEAKLAEGKAELEDADRLLKDAWVELVNAPQELLDARKQLDDGWLEYEDGKAEAEEEFAKAEAELADGEAKLADARDELSKLEPAKTYTLTRKENIGYACFESDTSIVAAVSLIFPVFFFLVAALVCMTTMKRMVDEQRTQIGVLKAIGYSRGQIIGKYLFYSGSAAAVGCIVGFAIGSTVLPLIMWEIYNMMYGFAPLEMVFDPGLAAITFAASMLCSMGSTYLSCRAELVRPAAELIRPKTPKAGKRVFLEHIGLIWKHLSFLQKVSVRNVLRYRSRFIMMVLGIGGCTALLVTGFGIKDSIANIAGDQYGEISLYDYSISLSEALAPVEAEEYLIDMGFESSDGLLVHSGSTDIISDTDSRSVYLVCPESNSLDGFVSLHSGDTPIPFPDNGCAVINIGLAQDIGVKVGDKVSLRDTDFGTVEVTISGICDNYIYNYVYVSPDTYISQLGKAPEFNAIFLNSDTGIDPNEESVRLGDDDRVSTVSANATFRDRLTTTLERLNLIVVVVVVCSGALAFVVLYNLTNINITERIREIATVKVLGFYPGETASYVFREINILACVGSLVGLFMGKGLHAFIMAQIQVEAMFFPCRVTPLSYVLSFVFTIAFTVLITNCMRPRLRKIHMAESLKSIE